MYLERNHRDRIYWAINYAEEFCGDEINLDTTADIACLSKFHYLRVFKNTIGETPVDFLQRIRLERAARKLVYLRKTPITEITFASYLRHDDKEFVYFEAATTIGSQAHLAIRSDMTE